MDLLEVELYFYLLGIGGVGMGNLASLLLEKGHQVTGVDAHVYSPMLEFLDNKKIRYSCGFDAQNIPVDVDVAIVGNIIRADNVEVVALKEKNIKLISMPQALKEYFLMERVPIVVAGTHGKTTTSAMMACSLKNCGKDPGYFIGGVANDLGTGSAIGNGEHFVLEGDEYDSAYFEKRPKFLGYAPRILILTGIEFDHCDIYANLQEIEERFEQLVNIVPEEGFIVANGESTSVRKVTAAAKCPVIYYGAIENTENDNLDVVMYDRQSCSDSSEEKSRFKIKLPNGDNISLISRLTGMHNALNMTAVACVLYKIGIDDKLLADALRKFSGVMRRQQIVFEDTRTVIINDFAHHPTAVATTLAGIRESYGSDYKVWALFEPRTNTSRRHYFQETLPEAFAVADETILYKVYREEDIKPDERLNRQVVCEKLTALGKKCLLPNSVDEIIEYLQPQFSKKNIFVIMTNGEFGGLKEALIKSLQT